MNLVRLWSISVLFLASCTSTVPPHPEFGRAQTRDYEAIVVRSRPFTGNIEFEQPLAGVGRGAAVGAGQASAEMILGCMESGGDPLVGLFCMTLTPIAAITGAIVGAGVSHTEQEITHATKILKDTIAAANPVANMQHFVVRRLRQTRDGRYDIRALSEHETNLNNAELAERGIDLVLELEMTQLDLAVFGRIDPDAAVIFTIRAHLNDTHKGHVSVPISWIYKGVRHDYFELAANNARLLHQSINQSYEDVSALIVDDLF